MANLSLPGVVGVVGIVFVLALAAINVLGNIFA